MLGLYYQVGGNDIKQRSQAWAQASVGHKDASVGSCLTVFHKIQGEKINFMENSEVATSAVIVSFCHQVLLSLEDHRALQEMWNGVGVSMSQCHY